MSDYSRVHDFSVKDALPVGDVNKKIKGSEVDSELDAIATANGTKANKVVTPTSGGYLKQDSGGDMADGGTVISAYIDTLLDDANVGAAQTTLGLSTFIKTLMDDADAEAARTTLEVSTSDTGSLILPGGTTGERDGSPVTGRFRHNTSLTRLEWYNGSSWVDAGGLTGTITTQGDIIRGDSGGNPERLALGTIGQLLGSDGTDLVNVDKLVEAPVQATTSGTNFDFLDIPSWVTTFHMVLASVSLSGTDDLIIRLGDAGGPENTGYVSSSTSGSASVATSTSTSGFIVRLSSAANSATGVVTFVRHDSNEWVASHSCALLSGLISGAGVKTLSGALDRVRLTRSGANTFDAGSVHITY